MLTLQFVPYEEISKLDSTNRIKKLLKVVKENKIVVMQGRLKPFEEAELIQKTMEGVNNNFKGIELCTIYPGNKKNINNLLKRLVIKTLMGDREGITIIGPATVVKEIKRDPNKIELFTKDIPKTRRRRK
jgi:hypothetical protein